LPTLLVTILFLIPESIITYTSKMESPPIQKPREEAPVAFGSVPEVLLANISAYTPRPEETDNTPFINAMGLRVQNGDVANNCLPFETSVLIDNKIYKVRDRMNSRYNCEYFDILMFDLQEARKFGRQIKLVTILR